MGEPRIYAPLSGLRARGEDSDDETDRDERDDGSGENHDERRERRVDPMLQASVNRRV